MMTHIAYTAIVLFNTIETLVEFINNHYAAFLTLHLLSMALGIGGATISDILFFKFLKDYRISKKEVEVLDVLKDFILGSLFFIIASGVALVFAKPELLQSPAFLVKLIIVTVVTINGICLHIFIAPHLIHLNLKSKKYMSRRWYKIAFAMGSISACSWYSALLIAGLKTMLPQNVTFLLSLYLAVLVCGIIGSQIFEHTLRKKAETKR